MNGYMGKANQLASRWLAGPTISIPSMADIAPQFQQIDLRESDTSQVSAYIPRFQTPGWVRTLADFLSPASQAAAADTPFVMQMSASGSSNDARPKSRVTGHWVSYFESLDDAELCVEFERLREKLTGKIAQRAALINKEFADHIPYEVVQLDSADVTYWEYVERCIFKPLGCTLTISRYPESSPHALIRSNNSFAGELQAILNVVLKRMPHLLEDKSIDELMFVHEVVWMLKKFDCTAEDLENALAERPDACTLRRSDSDSLFDALPDEDVDRCPDPLGDS